MTKRAEFMLPPTVVKFISYLYIVESSYSGAVPDQRGTALTGDDRVFSDDSFFKIGHDDNRRHIWRRTRQWGHSALTIAHHTSPQQGVIVWSVISYGSHFWHTDSTTVH